MIIEIPIQINSRKNVNVDNVLILSQIECGNSYISRGQDNITIAYPFNLNRSKRWIKLS